MKGYILLALLCAIFIVTGYNVGHNLGFSEGTTLGREDLYNRINGTLKQCDEYIDLSEEIIEFYDNNKDRIFACQGIKNIYITDLYKTFNKNLRYANCDGIEEYYTGYSFYSDYYDMEEVYRNRCYSSYRDDRGVKNPANLTACSKNYDCEDFSYAVNCLAELYELPCNYIVEIKYIEGEDITTGHLGVECQIRKGGSWEVLN